MSEPARRRRRIRTGHGSPAPATPSTTDSTTPAVADSAAPGPADAGAPGPAHGAPAATSARTSPVHDETSPWTGAAVDAEDGEVVSERGLRGLVGSGSSQVSPAAALRARDAARPRAEHLARAEAELTIVRRHWTPRD